MSNALTNHFDEVSQKLRMSGNSKVWPSDEMKLRQLTSLLAILDDCKQQTPLTNNYLVMRI